MIKKPQPFAARLREARIKLSASHEAVSRVCHVSPEVIEAWEAGTMSPEDIEGVLEMLRDPPRKLLWRKTDVDEDWPERLRSIRVEGGLTQRDVAAQLGVTPAAVSLWESGRTQPDVERRERIVETVESMETRPEEKRSPRGRKAMKTGRAL